MKNEFIEPGALHLADLAALALPVGTEFSLEVVGTSMTPSLPPRARLWVRRVDRDEVSSDLVSGALLVYTTVGWTTSSSASSQRQESIPWVTHRLLETLPGLLLRGDALPDADPHISPDAVIGVVVAVEGRVLPGKGFSRWLARLSSWDLRLAAGLSRLGFPRGWLQRLRFRPLWALLRLLLAIQTSQSVQTLLAARQRRNKPVPQEVKP